MSDYSAEERRRLIMERLQKFNSVKVSDLSSEFGVSEVTVRGDLTVLENRGMLSRTHGGAVGSYKAYYSMDLAQRTVTNEDEKKRIAQHAQELISDGDTLIMNAGTTPLYIMKSIQKKVTIVTNSIALALESGQNPNVSVILLGGEVNSKYQFTYGSDTLQKLRQYKADKLILSVDGISAENGLTTWYHQEAEICAQMISQAHSIIVAADYTKIGRTTFASIAPADTADFIITNTGADSEEIKYLSDLGIDITLT